MKEQILKILDEGKKYGYSNEAVAGELLFLFNAVRQSEQLPCQCCGGKRNDDGVCINENCSVHPL